MKQKLLSLLRTLGRALWLLLVNLVVIAAVLCCLGALFMWLWNMVMPDVFNVPEINLLQSIILLVLINAALISVLLSKHTDDD